MSFDYLFNPKSVAVVGASNNFGKWGFDVISALLDTKSKRKIYPVNRTASEIFGLKSYKNIKEISEPVELAVIIVPANEVSQVMKDCVAKEVKSALIVSSGFAELEGEGAKLEAEVIKIAKSGGIRFVGPNSFGHFNTSSDISTIFFTSKIKRGEIGLISQSGNLGVYIVRKGSEMGIGFSKFVSSGNEADLRFEDYIEYFNRDEETKVIVAYVEGLREGRYFLKLAKEVAKRKPIVVLKGGTTNAGSKAALSHTASLAGSTEIFDAALKQAGVIKVDEIDELLGVSAALLQQPLPKGRNVGILTGGGGYGVITADACEKLGLKVVSLSKNTIEKLDTILPSRWPRSNPVDTVMAYFTSYSCIKIMLEDENVDVILMVGGIGTAPTMRNQLRDNIPRSMREQIYEFLDFKEDEEVKSLNDIFKLIDKYQKPVIFSSALVNSFRDSKIFKKFQENGFLIYPTPERAVKVLACLVEYSEYLNQDKTYDGG